MQIKTGKVFFSNLFSNLFLIQAWIPEKALTFNPPGWSLSVEFIFYLIFPLLYNKVYRKVKNRTVFIYVILFWFISQLVFNLGITFIDVELGLKNVFEDEQNLRLD